MLLALVLMWGLVTAALINVGASPLAVLLAPPVAALAVGLVRAYSTSTKRHQLPEAAEFYLGVVVTANVGSALLLRLRLGLPGVTSLVLAIPAAALITLAVRAIIAIIPPKSRESIEYEQELARRPPAWKGNPDCPFCKGSGSYNLGGGRTTACFCK
jgi:hypothetical protein